MVAVACCEMDFRTEFKVGISAIKSLPGRELAAVIFLYHTIEKKSSIWAAGHRYITPFKKQIRFIQKHFAIVSTSELIQSLKGGLYEKRKIASIHFDAGFCSYLGIVLLFSRQFGDCFYCILSS